jgi:hypothetical protein
VDAFGGLSLAGHVVDRYGWMSTVDEFAVANGATVLQGLRESYPNSSLEEIASWRGSIPVLQKICADLTKSAPQVRDGTIVLEYTLPSGEGRCDAVLLMDGVVSVLEMKGKPYPSEEDLDQVRGYYHELRWNHRECAPPRRVVPLLVPIRSPPFASRDEEVLISSPASFPSVVAGMHLDARPSLSGTAFTAEDVARASPDIVKSARLLFEKSPLPRLKRSTADTEHAVVSVLGVCKQTAATRKRRLLFVSGVPGSGKTLVGLKLAHTTELDALVSPRRSVTPAAPVLYLSGNAPLVKVLRRALGDVAGGKTFVGDVMDWIRRHIKASSIRTPDQHVIVFDEAQRAWDAERMHQKHGPRGLRDTGSEPETLLRVMTAAPDWGVVVALIGQGQAIHVGEERGIELWPEAVRAVGAADWEVIGPSWIGDAYNWNGVNFRASAELELTVSKRQSFAANYPALIDALLSEAPSSACARIAADLRKNGDPTSLGCEPFHMCVTRSLAVARKHSKREISPQSGGLCGLMVSSKDKLLRKRYGVMSNLFGSQGLNEADWFAPAMESSQSCTWLQTAATEFQVQGLELDLGIVCWGSDLIWDGAKWSSAEAGRYSEGTVVRDPHALRLNSYRVLLTRGRRGSVIFLPPEPELTPTFERLVGSGFLDITPPPDTES